MRILIFYHFLSHTNIKNDDLDLNEVFADYFINEFEDPLNAYTGGMANYLGGVSSMAMGQGDPSGTTEQAAPAAKPFLPTGGIRTAFHSGVIAGPPSFKKLKTDDDTAPTPLSVMLQQQQQAMHLASQFSEGGITNVPDCQQHQPQLASSTVGPLQTVTAQSGVVLPVGVGIRLGGISGIAPATAQSRVVAPGTQYSHNSMWSSNNSDPSEVGMSEQAIAERRLRNREHAKRSRVRKKFMLESLQEQVRAMQKENNLLRMMVQEHIPEHAMQIISECCSKNPLFGEPGENGLSHPTLDSDSLVRSDFSLMQSLATGQKCFVLSDPKLPDNPIVFATPDFYKLTGYTSKEVLGRNCRFLQGPGTEKRAVDVIRKAIATGSDATVCLVNYKADGTPFWNQFFIAALRDSDNNIVNFVSHCLAYVFAGGSRAIAHHSFYVAIGWSSNGSRA